MSPQLAAFFAAHKTAILGGGAAAVAGLALLRRKQGVAVRTPAGVTVGATVPGTIPAAAVAGPAAGYDSSNFDVYQGLQPELEQILTEQRRQTTGTGITAAPAPVASTLLNPTYSGHLVRNAGGGFGEIQSDGSILYLTPDQISHEYSTAGSNLNLQQLQAADWGSNFSTEGNLLDRQKALGATPH